MRPYACWLAAAECGNTEQIAHAYYGDDDDDAGIKSFPQGPFILDLLMAAAVRYRVGPLRFLSH